MRAQRLILAVLAPAFTARASDKTLLIELEPRIAALPADVSASGAVVVGACASAKPRSDRSTSVQPVKRFSTFQVLSPWRSRTTLYMGLSSPAIACR